MTAAKDVDELKAVRRRYERERQARREAETIAERVTREHYEVSQRLTQAQELAHIGFWEWDTVANRTTWSDELFRIVGLAPPRAQAPHPDILERVHPEDRERVEQAVQGARRNGQPFDLEHRIARPDGTIRVLHTRGQVKPDAAGNPRRIVGTSHDITAWKEAVAARFAAEEGAKEVDRLRQLNQFKTHFINTAAHELLTPLTPMRAVLHMLSVNPAGLPEAELRKSIDMLSRNLERLTRLVGDLLDASRLEAQKLGLRKRRQDLSGLARDAAEWFQAEAARKGVKVATKLQPDLHVEIDADRFNQVLQNLISNALKFTPEGGTVTVETRRDEVGSAMLRVADTGMGIPPEFLPRMFEPFSRAHLALDQMQPGTGLGLYITKGIVDLHGGMVRCESKGPGQGSAFTVLLPV